MISSWSHSKLVEFEKCKYRTWLLHDQKIAEPQRPLPPGKTEHANDRGTRIHNGLEAYVNGTVATMPPEAFKFRHEVDKLRSLYKAGQVSLEGEWGMDEEWTPTAWKTAWLRLKLDALVHISETEAVAIDYKSGRKFGNEIKHGEQLNLYQLVTFLRYPALEVVHTELWYLDVDDITTSTFTRDKGMKFLRSFDRRGMTLTTNEEWPANPNIHSCKYCEYGPWGTGHCKVGMRKDWSAP